MKTDYSTKFKPQRLRKFIHEEKTAKQIMRECGISLYTLKEHLELLNRKDKKEYTIKGLKEYEEKYKRLLRRRKGKICAFDSNCMPDFRFADTFELEEEEFEGKLILKKVI
jgi:hypothetical protein